ncbi:MAG: ribulose-phosphate 3-epimerase [Lachnospiraceae bacterium]|nr:ribulose-phosphate 3-epimerase [Lachnospiraceae bacterium]
MYELSPSMLSADFNILGEQLKLIEDNGCKWLHIDVMDGAFVPNISFGMPVIKSIRKQCNMFFDVHMMVEEPGRFVDDLKKCGADMVTVHVEACKHLHRTLQAIREAGMQAGVVLNPATPLDTIDHVMDMVDMVLLMTVNPGYGGQKYIPGMTDKIRALRKKLDDAGYPDVSIEVDGGVNAKTIDTVLDAGADILVMGSATFGGDIAQNVKDSLAKIKAKEAEVRGC